MTVRRFTDEELMSVMESVRFRSDGTSKTIGDLAAALMDAHDRLHVITPQRDVFLAMIRRYADGWMIHKRFSGAGQYEWSWRRSSYYPAMWQDLTDQEQMVWNLIIDGGIDDGAYE